MLKFNEEEQIKAIKGALALRPQVEEIIDKLYAEKFDAVYYLGIGGTYASSMQAVTYMNGKSNLPVFVQHAAEYYTTGNKRLTKDSIVVVSSVTGTTQEVVKAVEEIKKVGATLIGFIDKAESKLSQLCDFVVTYPAPGTEQIKFFMVADRLMYLHGEFEDYSEYYEQLEHYLPTGLVEAEKKQMHLAYHLQKSIDVIACIILSEQGINGELFIHMPCVTGKNKAGSHRNLSMLPSFFTGR